MIDPRSTDPLEQLVEVAVDELLRFVRALGALAVVMLVLIALFGAPRAGAQTSATPKDCLPFNEWGDASRMGGALMQGRDNTIGGDWYVLWCPSDDVNPDTGARIWYTRKYAALDRARPPWAKQAVDAALRLWQAKTAAESFGATADVLGALWDAPNTLQLVRSIMSAALSADPVAALKALVVETIPQAGTRDYDDWRALLHQACQQAAVLPPWAASGPLPAPVITCTAPVATYVPSAVQYVVTSTAVYPLRADGTRNTLALPQRATLGQPCDCGKREILGLYGARYCDVTLPTVTQPVVAGCTAK